MDTQTVICSACGQVVQIGPGQVACPKCGAMIGVRPQAPLAATPSIPPAPSSPAPTPPGPPPPGPMAPPAPPPAPPGPPAPSFPERMKANKVLAGRICPQCSNPIELGNDVWNCPKCQITMHQTCRDAAGGCANPACAGSVKPAVAAPGLELQPVAAAAAAPLAAGAAGTPAVSGEALVDCKFCGEKIQAKAKKCRFCGEYQSAADRARYDKTKQAAEEDENLTGAEIAFGILCGGLACIVAIVWLIQGKKKGWKLLMISLIAQAVFTLISSLNR